MAVSGLILKVGIPLVLVVGGAVAAVAVPEGSDAAPAQLWIDSPADAARLAPGPVTVVAHAADELALDSMTLQVDGEDVATQNNLQTYNRLAAVQFTWNATDGEHFLVVTGGGTESEPVAVTVGAPSALGTPKPSAAPSSKPTPLPTPTTSSTPTSGPSATPSGRPSPTKTPSSPAPPADPEVLSVTVNPGSISGAACTGTVTVTARVKNATGGSAQVIGEGVGSTVDSNIGGSVSGNTFTATFKQRDLTGNNLGGPYRVEVTVTNETGFDVGAASFSIACSKD